MNIQQITTVTKMRLNYYRHRSQTLKLQVDGLESVLRRSYDNANLYNLKRALNVYRLELANCEESLAKIESNQDILNSVIE
jgi:hypothetical protein